MGLILFTHRTVGEIISHAHFGIKFATNKPSSVIKGSSSTRLAALLIPLYAAKVSPIILHTAPLCTYVGTLKGHLRKICICKDGTVGTNVKIELRMGIHIKSNVVSLP